MPTLQEVIAEAEERLGPNSKLVQDLKKQLSQEQAQSSKSQKTKRVIAGFRSRVSRTPGDDETSSSA